MSKPPGVFVVEGGWSPKLTATDSVLPLITYLHTSGYVSAVAHRYVDTKDGLLDAAKKWGQKQYDHLSLGYFGFHGSPGRLELGRTGVSLGELAEVLKGKCAGRVLYFASCEVLADESDAATRLLKDSGAKAVIGYTKYVDWLESSAFDLLLIDALTRYTRLPYAERWLRNTYPDMVRQLGLTWLHQSGAREAPADIAGSRPTPQG